MLANVTVSSQLEATLAARIEMAKLAQGEGDCKGYENGMRWQLELAINVNTVFVLHI